MNLKKAATAELKWELNFRKGHLYVETWEMLTGKTHHLADGQTEKALCGKGFPVVHVWALWDFEDAQEKSVDDLTENCTERMPVCKSCARKFEKMKTAALACEVL